MTHHLSVPVLRHKVFKPSYSCISSIRAYFQSLPKPIKDEELIVVGDRIFTDVVMANRMSRRREPTRQPSSPNDVGEKGASSAETEPVDLQPTHTGPLSVWTTGVWEKESMLMRYIEKSFMQGIQRYVVPDNGLGHIDTSRFLKMSPTPDAAPSRKEGYLRRFWNSISLSRSR